jgi:DNA primase
VAGRINDEDVQSLRERADIAAVIGDYTALKRAGVRLKGLCPFHDEKTPSFTVDPARRLFHCFGCGEGGDVYGFLQKIEALSFPEAVERLARITGYTLRYQELSPGQRKALGRRTRLTDCVGEAAAHYRAQLFGDEGAEAREYLKARGLAREHAEHFCLGWAADRWDGLVRHLSEQGFSNAEIVDAGLATRGQRGLIDRFRGRVMFPIYDAGGRDVVAFGGRVLPDAKLRTWSGDSAPPKYINSSETEVYKKSRVLYGLNWARAEIQRRDTALVVEGYMDVIGLHVAGVDHAVATCGTALTAEHFSQLEKFARRVVLALDADDAGYAAAERARALAEEAGMREVGVLPLAAGEDPADLAAHGADRVEQALGDVQTALEFQIAHLMRGTDSSTPEGQVEAYRRTFTLLAQIDDRALRYRYIRDVVAPAVGLSADRIETELDGERARRSHAPGVRPTPPRRDGLPRDPQLLLERQVLQVAIQRPDLLPSAWDKVEPDEFTAAPSQQLFDAVTRAPKGNLDAVLDGLPDDEARRRVRALALAELTAEEDPATITDLVNRLRAAAVARRISGLTERIRQRGEQMDPAERRRLSTELYDLERRRRDLVEGRDP